MEGDQKDILNLKQKTVRSLSGFMYVSVYVFIYMYIIKYMP